MYKRLQYYILLGVPTWLNAMTFLIGFGVGTLFGGFLSFIAFRRLVVLLT